MGWVGKGHEGKRNDRKEVKGLAMGGRIAEGKEREGSGKESSIPCLAPSHKILEPPLLQRVCNTHLSYHVPIKGTAKRLSF